MIGIIYKYTSPADKVYIGQTTQEKRRRKTFLNLNKSYGGDKIDAARAKYGPETFHYEVLYSSYFKTKEEATIVLDELEEYYIREYDTYTNGYNMTFGGYTNRGFKYSDEQKAIMSDSRRGRKLRPRTNEEKAYHSDVMKAKWASSEYRNLRVAINNSQEHKLKLSNSLRGENNGMYGKCHTDEAKQKMSTARMAEKNHWFGKVKSEEYRNKIKKSISKFHKENKVSTHTRWLISEKCSVAVEQYTKHNEYVCTFRSIIEASRILNIDASAITKCCKNTRGSAGGYKWKYVEKTDQFPNLNTHQYTQNEWVTTAEAVALSGRPRNVIYYHIKHHNLPSIRNGRTLKIHMPSLQQILK